LTISDSRLSHFASTSTAPRAYTRVSARYFATLRHFITRAISITGDAAREDEEADFMLTGI
jgi:hypothetical protein